MREGGQLDRGDVEPVPELVEAAAAAGHFALGASGVDFLLQLGVNARDGVPDLGAFAGLFDRFTQHRLIVTMQTR